MPQRTQIKTPRITRTSLSSRSSPFSAPNNFRNLYRGKTSASLRNSHLRQRLLRRSRHSHYLRLPLLRATQSASQKNSWIAQRLLDTGAILTGKTHLHQLAYGITGENADYGDCLQPRDATLLTGGSSSGAAASLQEGSALVAIGTDTGGSIRIPSALCGLAGYRTSHVFNTEALWAGGYHLAPSFDTLGILFHDLRDAAFLADAIFDIKPVPPPTTLRIGCIGNDFLHDCEPAVLDAYEAWKQRLAQHGAKLDTFDAAFWSESPQIYSPIVASESAAIHRGYFDHFEPVIAERMAYGASIPAAEIQGLHQRLQAFRSQMAALFEHFDLLLAPCAPVSKLRAGHDHTDSRKASCATPPP